MRAISDFDRRHKATAAHGAVKTRLLSGQRPESSLRKVVLLQGQLIRRVRPLRVTLKLVRPPLQMFVWTGFARTVTVLGGVRLPPLPVPAPE